MTTRVRAATLKDIPLVRALSIQMVVHGIPHTRRIDPKVVQARTRESLAQLEMTLLDRDFRILVAENTESGEFMGYIMLDFRARESSTGEAQVLIHDLAVKREHWGRMVVNHLIKEAAKASAERGCPYLVGEVTKANERTLGTALKGLGFEVERHQIMKRCLPDP